MTETAIVSLTWSHFSLTPFFCIARVYCEISNGGFSAGHEHESSLQCMFTCERCNYFTQQERLDDVRRKTTALYSLIRTVFWQMQYMFWLTLSFRSCKQEPFTTHTENALESRCWLRLTAIGFLKQRCLRLHKSLLCWLYMYAGNVYSLVMSFSILWNTLSNVVPLRNETNDAHKWHDSLAVNLLSIAFQLPAFTSLYVAHSAQNQIYLFAHRNCTVNFRRLEQVSGCKGEHCVISNSELLLLRKSPFFFAKSS